MLIIYFKVTRKICLRSEKKKILYSATTPLNDEELHNDGNVVIDVSKTVP